MADDKEDRLSPRSGAQALPRLRGEARRAVLALLLLVPAPSLGVLAAMVLLPGPFGKGVFLFSKLWILALPAVWHLLADRQRASWSAPRRGGLAPGAVLGLAIAAAIFAAYFLFGRGLIDAEKMRSAAAKSGLGVKSVYLAMGAYWIAVNSLLEEYVWRWFVFKKCETAALGLLSRGASAAAVLASALFFTLHHILALAAQTGWEATALGSAGVFLGGAAWSWLYLRYRSIWPCYFSHVIVDVPVFAIGWWTIF